MMIDIVGNSTKRHMKTPDDQDRKLRIDEFVKLLVEHEQRLSAYVHAIIPFWQDAEDVLQNTKLCLWKEFDSFQSGTDFAAWAFTIAGYEVRTYRKRCQRQRVCFSDDLLERIAQYMSTPSSSDPIWEKRLLALLKCVETLSNAKRKLLRLFCTEHQQIKDLAKTLGQSAPATRMALLRIRRSLFECVKKRLQKEQGR